MYNIKDFFEYDDQSLFSQIDDHLPSLSYKQRFYGFITCVTISLLCLIITSLGMILLFITPGVFAFVYTLSNIVLLLSTGFLIGFIRQAKYMLKKKRIIATILFVLAMIITLVVTFTTANGILIIVCVIIQMIAYIWYIMSYVPYARALIKNTVCTCIF